MFAAECTGFVAAVFGSGGLRPAVWHACGHCDPHRLRPRGHRQHCGV